MLVPILGVPISRCIGALLTGRGFRRRGALSEMSGRSVCGRGLLPGRFVFCHALTDGLADTGGS